MNVNLPTPYTENILENYKGDLQIFSDLFTKIREIYLNNERQILFDLQHIFEKADIKFVNEVICVFRTFISVSL